MVKEEIQLLKDFEELYSSFSNSLLYTKEDLFTVLYSASESVLPLERYNLQSCDYTEQVLDLIAERRKYYSDYFTDLKIIRSVGRDEQRKQCDFFERRFDSYVLNLVREHRAQANLSSSTNTVVEFIFDRGQEAYSLKEFEKLICSKFFIPPDSVYFTYGYEFVSIQIPNEFSQNFILAPYYFSRIVALKNQKVEFLTCKERSFFLMKWNIYMDGDILLGDVINSIGENQIIRVLLRGKESIALSFCGISLGDGYVQYLESLLNNYHENIPAVKGLYYSKNKYPLLIMEDCVSFEKGVTQFPVDEVNQVSFLLDIVNCIVEFMRSNQNIVIKVHSDVVYVHDNGVKLEAKLCPLYGYSFILDHRMCDDQSVSLVPDDLQWMENITKYLQFGNYTDKLPENHLMKKLLEQKWLSDDENIRPCSFGTLHEELHDLHGKFL